MSRPPSILFRPGVGTFAWGWKIRVALWCANAASWEVLERPGLVTSGRDGFHSDASLHYLRDSEQYIALLASVDPDERAALMIDPPGSHGAFDLRTWPSLRIPGQILQAKRIRYRDAIRRHIDEFFPDEFDITAEPTHIHNEHDPPADHV